MCASPNLLLAVAGAVATGGQSGNDQSSPKPVSIGKKNTKKPSRSKTKILRGPYLQQTTENSTYVVWQTDNPVAGEVDYGLTHALDQAKRERAKKTFHRLELTGLSSNSRYFYRVRSGPAHSTVAGFVSAKGGPLPFSFAVIGDYGTGSSNEHKNARVIAREPVDFIVTVGDNIYGNGFNSEYNRGLFSPFGTLMQRLPIWPTLGNHDYGNDEHVVRNNATAYYKNFVLPRDPAQERYYSFKWGNAEFLAINVEGENYGPGSPQYQWIESTLANSGACWKIPFLHEPPYSSRWSTISVRSALTPLFEKYGVKMVLSGHQHNYERTFPLFKGAQDANGITYFVTGGGGAALQSFPDLAPQPFPRAAFRGVFYHHLLISVNNQAMTVEAVGSDGAIRDQASLSCAPQVAQHK